MEKHGVGGDMRIAKYQFEFVIMVATTRAVFVTQELTNLLPNFYTYLFKNTSFKPSLIFAQNYLQGLYPWTNSKSFLEEIQELENLAKVLNNPIIRSTIIGEWILSKKKMYGYYLEIPCIASTTFKLLR